MLLLVVCQTFGGLRNFNCHLHILVSAGGFQEAENRWISRLQFDETMLMDLWRRAIIFYLRVMLRGGTIRTELDSRQFEKLLQRRSREAWSIFISKPMTKTKYLSYAGRYIRRPPFPRNHILEITERDVRFLAKDRRKGRLVTLLWSKRKLVQALSQHVPDRYRHGMRYFGLLAPQSIARTSASIFSVPNQKRRPHPAPLSWPELSLRTFGKDPLIDSQGQRMHRVESLRPAA